MIEKIEWEGKNLALIMRRSYEPDGVNFITTADNPLQLGVLKHQRGAKIKPHIHKNLPQTIEGIQEIIHIEYGKVEAEFYEETGKKIKSAILNSGDTILQLSGGHGFNILEEAKIIVVKQGPYHGVKEDKDYLDTKLENME